MTPYATTKGLAMTALYYTLRFTTRALAIAITLLRIFLLAGMWVLALIFMN